MGAYGVQIVAEAREQSGELFEVGVGPLVEGFAS